MSGGYRHKATTSTLFRVEVVVNCLLFLFALGAIPIDHIAVASQSPPTQLRILSATRDLWLSKISMVPIDQPLLPLAIASRTALSLSVLVRLLLKRLLYGLVIPIDHIAVASQSPPTLPRISSAARDLWLCNVLYGNKKKRRSAFFYSHSIVELGFGDIS